jgi:hypothetical protein
MRRDVSQQVLIGVLGCFPFGRPALVTSDVGQHVAENVRGQWSGYVVGWTIEWGTAHGDTS